MNEINKTNQTEDNTNNINNGNGAVNPFARSGLARSPTRQDQQMQQQQLEQPIREQELHEQQMREQERRDQQQPEEERSKKQRQPQLRSAWNSPSKQSKVEAAKTVADELREFVDKRHNVHKDIKDLVAKIQGCLGSAIKEWKKLRQSAEAAEVELAATKDALAAAVQQAKTGITPGTGAKAKGMSLGTEVTPSFTPKRTRSSPGDERMAAPKKQKNADARPPNEAISGRNGDTPWREVRNRKVKTKKDSAKTQHPIKKRKKGET